MHICIYTHVYIYIYIYRERERERFIYGFYYHFNKLHFRTSQNINDSVFSLRARLCFHVPTPRPVVPRPSSRTPDPQTSAHGLLLLVRLYRVGGDYKFRSYSCLTPAGLSIFSWAQGASNTGWTVPNEGAPQETRSPKDIQYIYIYIYIYVVCIYIYIYIYIVYTYIYIYRERERCIYLHISISISISISIYLSISLSLYISIYIYMYIYIYIYISRGRAAKRAGRRMRP